MSQSQRWQYPDTVEPVTVPAAPTEPTFFASVAAEVIRRAPPVIVAGAVLVQVVAPAPSTDWIQPAAQPTYAAPRQQPDATELILEDRQRLFHLAWESVYPDPLPKPTRPQPDATELVGPRAAPLAWSGESTVVRGGELVQYQEQAFVRVEPVTVPEISWLGQLPDPIRGPPISLLSASELVFEDVLHRAGLEAFPTYPDPLPNPVRPQPDATELVLEDRQRVDHLGWIPVFPERFPALALLQPEQVQPIGVEVVPDVVWLSEFPDSARGPLPRPVTEPVLVFVDILHRTGLETFLVYPDPLPLPIRPQPDATELTLEDRQRLDHQGWLPSYPDPLPKLLRTQPDASELVLEDRQRLDHLGWTPVYPEFLPALVRLQPENALPPRVEPTPDVGWFSLQPLSLPRALARMQPSASELPIVIAVVPAPELAWAPLYPEPLPLPPRGQPPSSELVTPRPVPLAWASETTVVHGGKLWQHQARPFVPFIPIPVGWLQQIPEPLPLPLRVQPDATELVLDERQRLFHVSWFPIFPDPQLGLRRPQPEIISPIRVVPEVIFLDKWWRPVSEPVLPAPPRLWTPIDLPWDETLFPLLLDKWWQPPADLIRFPRLTVGQMVLIEFAAPVIPVPFVLNFCQALWETVSPLLWPSAADPSGYQILVLPPTPSGFQQLILAPLASSGYVDEFSLPDASGFQQLVIPSPDPSGFVEEAEADPDPSGYVPDPDKDEPSLWDLI